MAFINRRFFMIDFHTHAFTESIAERAIESLESNSPCRPKTRGTAAQLLAAMDKCGIERSVLLTIATKPHQQTAINNWAAEVKSDRLLPFGSVHPDAPDAADELERIRSLGLYGVKLHPDYQHFYADEERMIPIYKKCAELKLPVLFHCGMDVISPHDVHCTPKAALTVHRRVPELTMILAHLGGNYMWEEAEKYLAGEDVYLDTAFVSGRIPDSAASRIIKKHGTDRILFASDMPWQLPSETLLMLSRLGLDHEETEMITHKNAEKILFD